jgi:type II secretory pathway component PulF
MANTKYRSVTLSNNEKIGLISNMSTMLAAGIPILESVNSLLEDAKGNPKKVLEVLRDDLTQGEKLHVTFSKFPRAFDSVTVNLIKASEEAGTLSTILRDLKDNIRKEMEFSDKIKSAMTYPVLIMMVFVGVLLMMLIVVIPKISSVFLRLNVELPLPTKALIFLSQLLLHNTVPFIGSIVFVVVGIFMVYRYNPKIILNPLFSLPLISTLILEIDLTRFSHNMFLLLNSGLPLVNALELSEAVVMRQDLKKMIQMAKEMVVSGKRLSDGFKDKKKKIPTIMVKLLEVGDKTGTLDKSLQDISEYLDYEVSATLKAITVLLEPIMLVMVGVLVGGMMLAIIAPIYGLIGQVGGR